MSIDHGAAPRILTVFLILLARSVASAIDLGLTGVPTANPKAPGLSTPNVLSPELIQTIVAQGSTPLENATGVYGFYGYCADGPMLPLPGSIQAPGMNVEATKTEPDKNTYLILRGQQGPDPEYGYGTHFLFQGHENSVTDPVTKLKQGYLSRINLDADGAHRVTLLATHDIDGNPLPVIDGSTWYPWSQRLLFTSETGTAGGVWQATPDYPSEVEDVSGVFGRGSYEAIQADSNGNLWIIEDTGGKNGKINSHARQPNSFLYRFVPYNVNALESGGQLQALQVMSLANPGQPIVFHDGMVDEDILSQDVKDLHTYGNFFRTQWVTLHDTAIDSNVPFSANSLAKQKGATPFKRPENGQFRPGSAFRTFFFDETGDTNALTEAGSQYGGFGSILKLVQTTPSAQNGFLMLFYLSDVAHSAFDNVAFWDRDHIVFVEDAGSTGGGCSRRRLLEVQGPQPQHFKEFRPSDEAPKAPPRFLPWVVRGILNG